MVELPTWLFVMLILFAAPAMLCFGAGIFTLFIFVAVLGIARLCGIDLSKQKADAGRPPERRG